MKTILELNEDDKQAIMVLITKYYLTFRYQTLESNEDNASIDKLVCHQSVLAYYPVDLRSSTRSLCSVQCDYANFRRPFRSVH